MRRQPSIAKYDGRIQTLLKVFMHAEKRMKWNPNKKRIPFQWQLKSIGVFMIKSRPLKFQKIK